MATVRVLAIIGSGETSPTMVTVHRELIARLGLSSPQAMVLATPYAFQENAPDVSARTQRYFADSVGLQARVAAGTSPDADPAMAPPLIPPDEEDEARQVAAIRAADANHKRRFSAVGVLHLVVRAATDRQNLGVQAERRRNRRMRGERLEVLLDEISAER